MKINPNSRNPALAMGTMTVGGVIVYVVAANLLKLDPLTAMSAAAVAGPMVTALLIRFKVFSPATVDQLFGGENRPTAEELRALAVTAECADRAKAAAWLRQLADELPGEATEDADVPA